MQHARARTAARSSINSTQSVYYMIKVLLAVFVGLLRARPDGRAGRRRARRRGARRSRWTLAHPDRRDRRHRRRCSCSSSSSCAGGGCMERYALLWLFAAVVLLGAGGLAAACSRTSRSAVGIFYAPSALFVGRVRLRPRAAAALLARHLAPGRPEQGARPAARPAAAARRRRSRRAREARARRRADERRTRAPDDRALLTPPLAVVVVCHDSADAICRRRCAALRPQLRAGDELVVVDNASARRHAGGVRARSRRRATVLETGENLGFAGGCHAGARATTRAAAAVPQPRRGARRRAASTRCALRRASDPAGARGRRS